MDDHAAIRQLARRKSADRILRIASFIVLTCGLVSSVLLLRTPSKPRFPVAAYVLVPAPAPMPTPKVIGKPVYPLRRSKDGRRLVDQTGVPFLLVGDSPQSLIVNLSEADAAAYLADRQAHGFNAVWVNLLCATYTGGRSDGSTYDGIRPFTTPGDLSTPNPAYFARADDMIRLAARYGMTVFLDPIETGSWLGTLESNGPTKDYHYGVYLGNRYKSFPNIVWLNGNDFIRWINPTDDADVRAVANGIRSADPKHLQTLELSTDRDSNGSLDDRTWAPIIGLDAAYTYTATYAQVLRDYERSTAPVFLLEANYEGEKNAYDYGSPSVLRKQEYWAMLSGATGQFYGNRYTWPFLSGWKTHLDTTGSLQMGYVTALFAPRQWYNLIPDRGHRVVTAGYGTFITSGAFGDNDYLTAARTPDGSLVIAYIPTRRTITVDLSQLAGPAMARWYDPTNGTYHGIAGSPLANRGIRQFAPPGTNSGGEGDWVLVLEATTTTR